MLTWEDSYAISRALHAKFPDADLENVSLEMIYTWTLALEGFVDEPELANDDLLNAIFREWLELEME